MRPTKQLARRPINRNPCAMAISAYLRSRLPKRRSWLNQRLKRWQSHPLSLCRATNSQPRPRARNTSSNPMRFHQVQPGEWVQPRRKNYLMKCCDCGLVHRMNFRVLKNGRGTWIQFQAFRLNDKVSAKSRRTGCGSKPARKGKTSHTE